MDKAEAGRIVEAVLGAVADALKAGDKVSLSSLGIFDINDRKARQGRKPSHRRSDPDRRQQVHQVPPDKEPEGCCQPAL